MKEMHNCIQFSGYIKYENSNFLLLKRQQNCNKILIFEDVSLLNLAFICENSPSNIC